MKWVRMGLRLAAGTAIGVVYGALTFGVFIFTTWIWFAWLFQAV